MTKDEETAREVLGKIVEDAMLKLQTPPRDESWKVVVHVMEAIQPHWLELKEIEQKYKALIG